MKHKLYIGNVFDRIKEIEDGSVQSIITSPPYWGLRKYNPDETDLNEIGHEKHPQEYVNKIVRVVEQSMRVLKDDGQMFLNIGDSFGSHKSGVDCNKNISKNNDKLKSLVMRNSPSKGIRDNWYRKKQKLLIPHRIAIALQDKGFIIRNDMVWVKKLMMYPDKISIGSNIPSAVKDRFSVSHEYIFQIVKSEKYYTDSSEIMLKLKESSIKRMKGQESWDRTPYKKQFVAYWDNVKKHIPDKDWNIGDVNVDKALPVSCIHFRRNGENSRFLSHFAKFPKSMVDMLLRFSTRKGDTMLDPFMGSGTVIEVAEELQRNSIGIELYKDYYDVVKKRCERFYNKKLFGEDFELEVIK